MKSINLLTFFLCFELHEMFFTLFLQYIHKTNNKNLSLFSIDLWFDLKILFNELVMYWKTRNNGSLESVICLSAKSQLSANNQRSAHIFHD